MAAGAGSVGGSARHRRMADVLPSALQRGYGGGCSAANSCRGPSAGCVPIQGGARAGGDGAAAAGAAAGAQVWPRTAYSVSTPSTVTTCLVEKAMNLNLAANALCCQVRNRHHQGRWGGFFPQRATAC